MSFIMEILIKVGLLSFIMEILIKVMMESLEIRI